MFESIRTIDEYLMAYGPLLGRKAVEALRPLYVLGRDESIDFSGLLRRPKPAQANVLNALVRAWDAQRAMIVCGEMGTGKTYLGAAGVHAHARGKPYRACVMAPNHLIDKWGREIDMAIPGARVLTFERSDPSRLDDSYKAVLAYAASCRDPIPQVKHAGGRRQERARWTTPTGPEWVIVGRNQSKWDAGWDTIGTRPWTRNPGHKRPIVVGVGQAGADGKRREVAMVAKVCPACGQPIRLENGLIGDPADLDKQKDAACRATYLQEVAVAGRPDTGLDVIRPVPERYGKEVSLGREIRIGSRTYIVRECGEPLWSWTPRPRKWAPARIIQAKMRGLFDYFLLDEMHEEEGETSAQALAAAKIMSASTRVLGLTGTLIGGFAHHLFPLMMRMCPASLIDDGFAWGDGKNSFADAYGRIDTTIVTKYGGSGGTRRSRGKRRGSSSMRQDDGDSRERRDVRPGVMPTFFGRHLIDKAVFIGLEEMGDDLPPLIDDDRSLVPVALSGELAREYERVQAALVAANNDLLRKGSLKLMSALQHTLLAYPDMPYGWAPPAHVDPTQHAVGSWRTGSQDADDWQGIVTPADLGAGNLFPKEGALFDLCRREASEGRQVWVYCLMTDKYDVQGRLRQILENGGLTAKVLSADTVDPRDREAWIAANGPGTDVIISHPRLVSTGLDFFDAAGTFNFCTIVFYQSSYEVNLMRQASRRHWRIGQPRECRTYYLYYAQTMQHRAVKHIGEKYAAAKALEGQFSAEGLAAMAEGGLAMTELAKALEQTIDDPRAEWARLRQDAHSRPSLPSTAAPVVSADPIDFSLLDEIDPDSLELTAEESALLDDLGADLLSIGINADSLAP
ncbi:MAG TPA: hypothetical protein VG406_00620 [Isosphaeraceae bacterium]|nr:hypothetical protein [Isosphaeraceae bacterium]